MHIRKYRQDSYKLLVKIVKQRIGLLEIHHLLRGVLCDAVRQVTKFS